MHASDVSTTDDVYGAALNVFGVDLTYTFFPRCKGFIVLGKALPTMFYRKKAYFTNLGNKLQQDKIAHVAGPTFDRTLFAKRPVENLFKRTRRRPKSSLAALRIKKNESIDLDHTKKS